MVEDNNNKRRNRTRSNVRNSVKGKVSNGSRGFVEEYRNLILPSIQELENYEKHFPGSVQKLLEMGKLEQRHRHQMQDKYAKSYNFTYRMGQIFGLFYSVMMVLVIIYLVLIGQPKFALILLSMNAGLGALAIITTATTRSRQRRFNRHLRMRNRAN